MIRWYWAFHFYWTSPAVQLDSLLPASLVFNPLVTLFPNWSSPFKPAFWCKTPLLLLHTPLPPTTWQYLETCCHRWAEARDAAIRPVIPQHRMVWPSITLLLWTSQLHSLNVSFLVGKGLSGGLCAALDQQSPTFRTSRTTSGWRTAGWPPLDRGLSTGTVTH